MRRIFLLLIGMLFMQNLLFADEVTANVREKIVIKLPEETPKKKITRSVLPEVYGFYDRETKEITLCFTPYMGEVVVTLSDAFGVIIYTDVVYIKETDIQIFPLPEQSGEYTLYIESESYKGIGKVEL